MAVTERVRNLSIGEYFLRRYERTPRSFAFKATNAEEFEVWKREFAERVSQCLEPFPEPTDPDPEVIEVVDEGDYWREKVIFNSEPDMSVIAYVLIPKDVAPGERRPAVLAAHGHGGGKDDVCGIGHGESERVDRIASLNYDYARQFALRGYVVIAPDWRAFGERRAGGATPSKDVCDLLEDKALLFGQNLLTLNVWDARCAISYLQSRPDVDPERIGCAGLSYGGTMTLFTTVTDQRVKCAVVSGYLNRFDSFALGKGHFCGAQLPIGLLEYGEMEDVACLIAPRPLLIESATGDSVFPIEASRRASEAVRRAYAAAGVPERFDVDEFDGAHEWSGRKAYDWMARWL